MREASRASGDPKIVERPWSRLDHRHVTGRARITGGAVLRRNAMPAASGEGHRPRRQIACFRPRSMAGTIEPGSGASQVPGLRLVPVPNQRIQIEPGFANLVAPTTPYRPEHDGERREDEAVPSPRSRRRERARWRPAMPTAANAPLVMLSAVSTQPPKPVTPSRPSNATTITASIERRPSFSQ